MGSEEQIKETKKSKCGGDQISIGIQNKINQTNGTGGIKSIAQKDKTVSGPVE